MRLAKNPRGNMSFLGKQSVTSKYAWRNEFNQKKHVSKNGSEIHFNPFSIFIQNLLLWIFLFYHQSRERFKKPWKSRHFVRWPLLHTQITTANDLIKPLNLVFNLYKFHIAPTQVTSLNMTCLLSFGCFGGSIAEWHLHQEIRSQSPVSLLGWGGRCNSRPTMVSGI